MPVPNSSAPPTSSGGSSNVESIRKSWVKQSKEDFASEVEFPHLASSIHPSSTIKPQAKLKLSSLQSTYNIPTNSTHGIPSEIKQIKINILGPTEMNVDTLSFGAGSCDQFNRLEHSSKGLCEVEAFFSPRRVVSTREALDKTEICPAVTIELLAKAWNNREDSEKLFGNLIDRMKAVSKYKDKGLVHYKQCEVTWCNITIKNERSVRKKNLAELPSFNMSSPSNASCTYQEISNHELKGREEVDILKNSDDEDENWYRGTTDYKNTIPEDVTHSSSFDFKLRDLAGTVGSLSRNILSSFISNNITVTPVVENKVIVKEGKENNKSYGGGFDVGVSNIKEDVEIGICPLCHQQMPMKELPKHASDCQDY